MIDCITFLFAATVFKAGTAIEVLRDEMDFHGAKQWMFSEFLEEQEGC